jgi:hypothetical protein
LLQAFAENGYHSYRLSTLGMKASDSANNYTRFLSDLKRTIDPNGILAPGRYTATTDAAALAGGTK